MRVFETIKNTNVNGPGNRYSISLSGCFRNCKGCFNKDTNLYYNGRDISIDSLLEDIKNEKENIEGVSVSGGEPFYQDSELALLLERILNMGLNTLVFSGYTFSQIKKRSFKAINYCSYLIEGRFISALPSCSTFQGSNNQRFLELENGEIKNDLTSVYQDDYNKSLEIIINSDKIISTGFMNF